MLTSQLVCLQDEVDDCGGPPSGRRVRRSAERAARSDRRAQAGDCRGLQRCRRLLFRRSARGAGRRPRQLPARPQRPRGRLESGDRRVDLPLPRPLPAVLRRLRREARHKVTFWICCHSACLLQLLTNLLATHKIPFVLKKMLAR